MQSDDAASLFYFRAGSSDGSVFTGELQATSENAAIEQLQRQGFTPLRLGRQPIKDRWFERDIVFAPRRRMTLSACEAFCRELCLLLTTGITLSDAMSLMIDAERRAGSTRAFLVSVRHHLRLGQLLSSAIESSGYTIPRDMIAVLRAGEASGSLASALTMLGRSYGESNRFTRSYRAALAYPALLLVVSIGVFGLIAFFVAPNISVLFVSMNRPVPIAIAVLNAGASFLSADALWLAAAVAAAVIALATPSISRPTARRLSTILMMLPVVGDASRWASGRRFAATLRLYLSSRVPIATALVNATAAAGFSGKERQTALLINEVKHGRPLAESLIASRLLPNRLSRIVAVGESSGELLQVLEAVEEEAKARFEQGMAMISSLLAPVLILLVGSLIGTVIFSVFSALLDLNNVVQ